jgi:hypothetical protein
MSEELGWNDEIKEDSGEFTVIPAGEYDYTIVKFERKRFEGKGKVEECNMAVITAEINQAGEPVGKVTENFFMLRKFEWKLSQLFRSIGQKKHGEPLIMDWSRVEGATGRCKITVRKFKKTDGGDGESNNIEFLDPPELDDSFNPNDLGGGSAPQPSSW